MAPKNPTSSSRNTPNGITNRGFPAQESKNPKNSSSRRPDVIGQVPGMGGAVNQTDTDGDSLSDNYPSTISASRRAPGSSSGEPAPAVINRGYTVLDTSNTPAVRVNTSSNRQRYGIDPGEFPEAGPDTTKGATIPKFGSGTNGD